MKQRTNISLDAALLEEARKLDLNVSGIAEAALREELRRARAEAWARENKDALAAHRAWVEKNGLPLAKWQVWTPE